jgi:hypothetical protein
MFSLAHKGCKLFNDHAEINSALSAEEKLNHDSGLIWSMCHEPMFDQDIPFTNCARLMWWY